MSKQSRSRVKAAARRLFGPLLSMGRWLSRKLATPRSFWMLPLVQWISLLILLWFVGYALVVNGTLNAQQGFVYGVASLSGAGVIWAAIYHYLKKQFKAQFVRYFISEFAGKFTGLFLPGLFLTLAFLFSFISVPDFAQYCGITLTYGYITYFLALWAWFYSFTSVCEEDISLQGAVASCWDLHQRLLAKRSRMVSTRSKRSTPADAVSLDIRIAQRTYFLRDVVALLSSLSVEYLSDRHSFIPKNANLEMELRTLAYAALSQNKSNQEQARKSLEGLRASIAKDDSLAYFSRLTQVRDKFAKPWKTLSELSKPPRTEDRSELVRAATLATVVSAIVSTVGLVASLILSQLQPSLDWSVIYILYDAWLDAGGFTLLSSQIFAIALWGVIIAIPFALVLNGRRTLNQLYEVWRLQE